MNIGWNTEQEALKEKFGEFARSQVAPRAAELAERHQFDQSSWEALLDLGLWDLVVPEKYSGRSPNWWDFSAALEGIAENCADGGFLLSLISQAGFIKGLAATGSAAQQERYFPRVRAGAVTATCIAEPHSGTDTGNLRTQATGLAPHWVLNGSKWNIAHAPTADIMVVVARVPELAPRDITLFILDERHSAHIERAGRDAKMGNRTIPTGGLTFLDVPVTGAEVFGEPGHGIRALVSMVGIDRVYYGWMGALLLKPLLAEATRFVKERESFHRPLHQHQYVQSKLVETLVGLEQSRFVGMGSLAQLLAGHPDAVRNGSIAKLTGARALEKGARELLSLLGSDGYHIGMATRLAQDALGFMSVGGTEEMHRINIFNQYLRRTKK